jgi:Domain of unknown function (DUF5666)
MTTQHLTRGRRPWLLCGSLTAVAFLLYAAWSSAGIQGSGRNALSVIAFGRITAFGSIFVDGTEYSIDHANISFNGQPGAASELQVGQIVTVQAVQVVGDNKATAASVSFTADVIGPITRLDPAGRTMTVLGQTVRTDSATVFGPGIQADTLGGLQPGVMVGVSALEDASGTLSASRVDLLTGSASLQVKGTVQALDVSAQTFKLNDLTVDYSGVHVRGKLANGSTATVQSNESPARGVLYAAQVQVSNGMGGSGNEIGRLEGFITSMTSDQVFTVAGQSVQTDANTKFVLHGQALAPNLSVTVQGAFNAAGTLLANKVESSPPHN